MGKIKQWIVSHKVWSIVIASVLVVGIALSIALPLTLKKCDHEYSHACDTTCNICGETREISYYATGEDPTDNLAGWVGSENIDGVAGGQYVFKIDEFDSQYSIYLTTNRMEWGSTAISKDKYSLRFFDKDFNELNVDEDFLPDVAFLDGNGTDITEQYEGKVIYLMVTLNETMTFCPVAN